MWREGPAEKPRASRRETPCLWLTDLMGGGDAQLVSEDGADERICLGPVPFELLEWCWGGHVAEKWRHRQGCVCAQDSV